MIFCLISLLSFSLMVPPQQESISKIPPQKKESPPAEKEKVIKKEENPLPSLNGIFYINSKEWSIWINGRLFIPKNRIVQQQWTIQSVQEDHVTLVNTTSQQVHNIFPSRP